VGRTVTFVDSKLTDALHADRNICQSEQNFCKKFII